MNVDSLCRLPVPSNFNAEVDSRLILYFTSTFFLVICSFFSGIEATLTSNHSSRFPLDVSTSHVDVEA